MFKENLLDISPNTLLINKNDHYKVYEGLQMHKLLLANKNTVTEQQFWLMQLKY